MYLLCFPKEVHIIYLYNTKKLIKRKKSASVVKKRKKQKIFVRFFSSRTTKKGQGGGKKNNKKNLYVSFEPAIDQKKYQYRMTVWKKGWIILKGSCLFSYFYICKLFFVIPVEKVRQIYQKYIPLYEHYAEKRKEKNSTDELYSVHSVHIPSIFVSCQFFPN